MQRQGMQLQIVQMTPVVKKLIIANVAIWLVLQIIVEQYFLPGRPIISYFSLVPGKLLNDFMIWQPFTYMFLHSLSITHIVFNMLMLWWFGAELEQRWGSKLFLIYYLACGVGAAFIYTLYLWTKISLYISQNIALNYDTITLAQYYHLQFFSCNLFSWICF